MPKIRKLNMSEVSGVDYPAHLANGFSITKSADPNKTSAFLKALGREVAMPKIEKTAFAAALAENPVLKAALSASDLQPVIDAINAVVEAQGGGDSGGDAPADPTAGAAPAGGVQLFDADGNPVDANGNPIQKDAAIAKALGGEGSEAFKLYKAQEARLVEATNIAKAAQATADREVTKRLDNEAVAVLKSAHPHLSMEHETVAPALRKFASADADAAKVITDLLKSLEGQAEASLMFTEVGTTGGGQETDAWGSIVAKAAELRGADASLTQEAAIAKAASDPALAKRYDAEKRGA